MQPDRHIVTAKVTNIKQETTSTKSFDLFPYKGKIDFLPGQWVDLFVSLHGSEQVAGYSITSTPCNTEFISLAVKNTGDDEVTQYIHQSMREGDTVSFSTGGSCVYTPEQGNAILIAGGIGITPLVSIFRYIGEATNHRATIIHSVCCYEELLFTRKLKDLCLKNPDQLSYVYTISSAPHHSAEGFSGRVNADMLNQSEASTFDTAFVCGPDSFVDSLSAPLQKTGFNKGQIKSETWW
jgi:ferredoxin-NADP reductase